MVKKQKKTKQEGTLEDKYVSNNIDSIKDLEDDKKRTKKGIRNAIILTLFFTIITFLNSRGLLFSEEWLSRTARIPIGSPQETFLMVTTILGAVVSAGGAGAIVKGFYKAKYYKDLISNIKKQNIEKGLAAQQEMDLEKTNQPNPEIKADLDKKPLSFEEIDNTYKETLTQVQEGFDQQDDFKKTLDQIQKEVQAVTTQADDIIKKHKEEEQKVEEPVENKYSPPTFDDTINQMKEEDFIKAYEESRKSIKPPSSEIEKGLNITYKRNKGFKNKMTIDPVISLCIEGRCYGLPSNYDIGYNNIESKIK